MKNPDLCEPGLSRDTEIQSHLTKDESSVGCSGWIYGKMAVQSTEERIAGIALR